MTWKTFKRIARALAPAAMALACASGCAEPPSQPQPSSRPASQAHLAVWRIPRRPVADGIEALGGLTAWRRVRAVSYDAVVTLYHKDGQGYVNRHGQVLDLQAWTLTAQASRPRGSWRAVVDPAGKCTLEAQPGVLDAAARRRLLAALPVLKHRVTGPFNLCATRETAGRQTKTRVNGAEVIRVAVEGDTRQATAYYFDAVTGYLRFVTAGDDRPGGRGTITVYHYRRHPQGMRFPRRIQVFRFGQYVLIGSKQVLEMDLRNVQFHRRTGPPRKTSSPASS